MYSWRSQTAMLVRLPLFTDGLAVARRAQDWSPLLVLLYNLALARQAQGDLAGAAGHLQEGLTLAAQVGDETSAAYYLQVLAGIAGQQDNPQRAVRLLTAARSIPGRQGQRLAARLRATRPARRGRPGRVALPHGRRGVRGGPGVGPVRRKQTCGGIRTPATMTRRGRVRSCGAAGRPGRQAGPGRAARCWKAEIAAAGDARAARQARANQAGLSCSGPALTTTRRPGRPPGITQVWHAAARARRET